MKAIFLMLMSIGVFSSVFAADENTVGNAPYNNANPDNHIGDTNFNNTTNPNMSTNPNNKPNNAPTPDTSLGNAGNTGAIGTDNGGGNGPVH